MLVMLKFENFTWNNKKQKWMYVISENKLDANIFILKLLYQFACYKKSIFTAYSSQVSLCSGLR